MAEQYRTIRGECRGEIEEKRSRFLAVIRHIEERDALAAFVEEMRKTYWDARHHCSACILGKDGSFRHSSDDGEPSGTAGRPMLDVLDGSGLTDLGVVVIRYFGGTLLGTGGLVRAYSDAVRAALAHAEIEESVLCQILRVETDYNGIGKLQYLCAQREIPILDAVYEEKVTCTIAVRPEELESVRKAILNSTSGAAAIEEEDRRYILSGSG